MVCANFAENRSRADFRTPAACAGHSFREMASQESELICDESLSQKR